MRLVRLRWNVAFATTLLLVLIAPGASAQEDPGPPPQGAPHEDADEVPPPPEGDPNEGGPPSEPEPPESSDEPVTVDRISGENRYATAAALAAFFEPEGTVFVANGGGFPDALAGGPVASRADSAILLVSKTDIPTDTRHALDELRPSRIKVLGGAAAVSQAVEDQLRRWAPVDRIAGRNRYETAAAVTKSGFPSGARGVLVATGRDFPDALSGATRGAAHSDPLPILLVEPTRVPEATLMEIQRLQPSHITILGGPSVVSEAVAAELGDVAPVERIAGENRYATSAEVARLYGGPGVQVIFITTGRNFPDALAAAPVAGFFNSPTLLVPPRGSLPPETVSVLETFSDVEFVVGVGGEGALSDEMLQQIGALFD